jgi:predicted NUDIX family NTP pyrophosphohydrolase
MHRREISTGILAFRRKPALEVLLAHPGGPFWAKKDDGVWTIPKGLVEPGDDLVATARREFTEETNLAAYGTLNSLAPVNQKSGKVVHAFAVEADFELGTFSSNTFEIEWPPKSGKRQSFFEIDRIAYFALPAAKIKIIAYQLPLLLELENTRRLSVTPAIPAASRPHRARAPKARAAPRPAIRAMPAAPSWRACKCARCHSPRQRRCGNAR